jgi:hypothetical protein
MQGIDEMRRSKSTHELPRLDWSSTGSIGGATVTLAPWQSGPGFSVDYCSIERDALVTLRWIIGPIILKAINMTITTKTTITTYSSIV